MARNSLFTASGKNSRNFHTLGYEMGNLQKLVFLHTQKVPFHTLENNFIPWSLFHTLKTFFIPLYINFIPLKFVSYLENFFHTFIQQFHTLWNFFLLFTVLSFHTKHKHFVPWTWYFIPSGQVFIPHATNFILIISFSTLLIARLIVCIHSFTTERTSHVSGCFLWPNYVAQSSSAPTGWLWPAPTAPTCQASDALEPGSQTWSRLVSVLHAWTANSGAHTSFCVCTTSERRRHSLRTADHNRACTPPYSKF